jgi:hypothetical protein
MNEPLFGKGFATVSNILVLTRKLSQLIILHFSSQDIYGIYFQANLRD